MRPSPAAFAVLALLAASCDSCDGKPGNLQVVSYPRGRLVVDGRATSEQTPISHRRIASGSHEISILARGVRFEPQRVTVRSGRTTHLYFRARDPEVDAPASEICRTGRPDHCMARIESTLRAGNTTEARRLAQIALAQEQHEGYEILLRQIIARLGGDAGPEPTPDE